MWVAFFGTLARTQAVPHPMLSGQITAGAGGINADHEPDLRNSVNNVRFLLSH